MEYKTANELKSKEYIIDPETEEIFQIINIKPGNKPRILLVLKNNFSLQKSKNLAIN